jgi:HSP20 family protein
MALVSVNPFGRLLELQRELDRSLTAPSLHLESGAHVFPPVNVFADGDSLVIRAEVPGFKTEEIGLTLARDCLTLTGQRQPDDHAKPGSYHRREREFGSFSRSIQLPNDLDPERATAQCRNGLLTVRIPKAAAAKPRQIRVQAPTEPVAGNNSQDRR